MPNVAMVGQNIIDNPCLTKSPCAHVMSDGVNSTVHAWKVTHWKPQTIKLKPCMRTSSWGVCTFILCDTVTQSQNNLCFK